MFTFINIREFENGDHVDADVIYKNKTVGAISVNWDGIPDISGQITSGVNLTLYTNEDERDDPSRYGGRQIIRQFMKELLK
jgi:hypothetical protein